MSKPAIFIDPHTKREIPLSEEVICEGKELTFTDQKKLGWSPGGWYVDEDGTRFMVKFSPLNLGFPYVETLLNELAEICVGKEFIAGEVKVGHGEVDGKTMPCILTSEVKNYQDLIALESASKKEFETIALRKRFAEGLHKFYVFCALIGNDDLNEENLGIKTDSVTGEVTPLIIDYGTNMTFLNQEYAGIPFQLASFIGHRNLNGMQYVRRRYFGHDDLLDPFQAKLVEPKTEDISYLSILLGIKAIIDSKDHLLALTATNLTAAMLDDTLSEEERSSHLTKYEKLTDVLRQRIEWMEVNFSEDLTKLNDAVECEEFAKMKWRLHPTFNALMELENFAFTKCAKDDLAKNLVNFSDLLSGRSREEILALDLKTVEKSDLNEFANSNFMLHSALIAGDFELAKWMVANDIGDINSNRKLRTHNYQLFRTTPLHAAIAIYNDKLFYQKFEDLEPLREMIGALQEKFIEKNGDRFDDKRDYKAEGINDSVAVKITFAALTKYHEQTLPLNSKLDNAANKIKSFFKAHNANRLSNEGATLEGGRT